VDSDGYADPAGASSQFLISPVTSGPVLTAEPASAGPGESVTVSRRGFGDDEKVSLSIGSVSSTVQHRNVFEHEAHTGACFSLRTAGHDRERAYLGSVDYVPLALTSPWHQLGNGPERQGSQPSDRVFSQEPVPDKIYRMQPVVISDVTAPIDSSPAVAGKVTTAPAVDAAAGEVVVGDAGGDVTAFSTSGTKARTVLWTFKAGWAAGAPLISGGTVYGGSADGDEYALNESTGAKVWSTALGGTPSPAAVDSKGDLMVGTSADRLFALQRGGGKVIWERTAPGAVTCIAATSGMIFLGCANGDVAGYRPTGPLEWLAPTGAGLYGTPAVVDNAVIVGAEDTGLYVFTPFGLPMI
jgi:outer membrane protein assembly factor BamB